MGRLCVQRRHARTAHNAPSCSRPAAGRFAGPLVVAGVTKIATPSGEAGYCTQWSTGADGAPDCIGPYDQQCVITGAQQRWGSAGAALGLCQALCCMQQTLPSPSPPLFLGDRYWVGGCVLLHAIPMYAAMAGLSLCLCLAFHVVLSRHWDWDEAPDSAGERGGEPAKAADAEAEAAPLPAPSTVVAVSSS